MSNKKQQPSFFFPFQDAGKRMLIIWISTVILLVLFLYEGNENFFLKHYSDGIAQGPLLDWYKYIYKHSFSLLLLAIIPICIIKFSIKEPLRDFGLTIGDWKFGIRATVISMIIMLGPLYLSSHNPEFRKFYPLTTLANQSWGLFALWGLTYLPHYIGWEVMFRGYLGMGLKKQLGAFQAIMIQVVITTLLHIGKPEGETWSTIPAGIYMGLLTYRTGSVYWAILFHFYAGMMNTWFAGIPI